MVYPGEAITGIGANAEIERALFSLPPDGISEPLPIARGYVVARFRETHPGGPPPLEEVRDTVSRDLRNERALSLATEQATALLSAARDSGLLDAAAAAGETGEESFSIRRGDPVGSLATSPALEEALFSTAVDTPTLLEDMPGGPLVFQVTGRIEVSDEDIALRADEVRESMLAGRRQQMINAIARELFLQADVEYNETLLQQIDNPQLATPATDS